MNLTSLLVRAARTRPDHPAVLVGERPVLSYAQLAANAAALGSGLKRKLGLAVGDRVALVMTNCGQYVECLMGCWHAGLVTVPVNAKLHAREIAFILENSGARAVFATGDLAGTVSDALGFMGNQAIAVIDVATREFTTLHTDAIEPVAEPLPSDPAWIFYTSGTTGRPKGATLTHRNLLTMTLSYLSDVDSVTPQDCILHAAPMSHGSGIYILPYVAAMAAHVIPESGRFDPAEMRRLIEHHRGVGFFAAPTMVNRLVNAPEFGDADLRNLRSIVYGGGPMYVEDCKKALALFGPKLAQIYGQGESPMTITVLPKHLHADSDHPDFERRLASVGYAQASVEVKTIGDDGEDVPPDATGEIVVRGDVVMAGYWNDAPATQAALGSGWLRTGDVGSFAPDGLLTLKDRSKDVIISGGSNIYPREVEEALLRHPGVGEVSVIGRPHADWGEEVVAFVVPAAGVTVTPQELDSVCVDTIARFKRPKAYVFLDEMPKNNYGKIVKTALRARDAKTSNKSGH